MTPEEFEAWQADMRSCRGPSEEEIRADERRKVAEEIAEAITRSVCDPPRACANRACTDCARYMQAQEDAIIARRIGEACDAR